MRRRFLVMALLVFAGCATPPPLPRGTMPAWTGNWTMQGRFSIEDGDQNVSGSIRWQHRGDVDELLLSSPLGQVLARVVRDAEGALLELPQQPPRRAADADTLTRDALGYILPVAGLAWWIQARPDPGRVFDARHDAAGRLTELRQDGWVIEYQQYADNLPFHPRKLRLSRDDLAIRLVTDSWGLQ